MCLPCYVYLMYTVIGVGPTICLRTKWRGVCFKNYVGYIYCAYLSAKYDRYNECDEGYRQTGDE